MLTRIEDFYLNILRVIILFVATLALGLAVLGGIQGLPVLARLLAPEDSKIESGGLREFIAEQRVSDTEAPVEDSVDGATASKVPSDLEQSVNNLISYVRSKMELDPNEEVIRNALVTSYDSIDADYQQQYAASLMKLTRDLNQSKGRPLSQERLGTLIDWHKTQFNDAIVAKQAAEAAEETRAMFGLSLAAGAMLAFIMIVFYFIFVKIERNLRILSVNSEARA